MSTKAKSSQFGFGEIIVVPLDAIWKAPHRENFVTYQATYTLAGPPEHIIPSLFLLEECVKCLTRLGCIFP